jgi:hypothetical protein
MKRILSLLALIMLLALTGSAQAMSSPSYRLDWFTPLVGGGGGSAGSANYSINFTVGQTATSSAASASYQSCLGYWCGESIHPIYMPMIIR